MFAASGRRPAREGGQNTGERRLRQRVQQHSPAADEKPGEGQTRALAAERVTVPLRDEREEDDQEPALLIGRFTAPPPAACSSRLMRS
jgi:hypothetical protein